ncbi:MAG TPA: 3-deoxy-D-manno-octulosonic acid transferase, partial [Acetobacteraceae bacterium]|nr:3-deoxy-D-manno-octulosonic acid transferase [Acetobacteraceae bacterium]
RHPDRGGQIARTIEGLPFTRRSLGQPPPSTGVWIADTLGELGLWYRIAGIALIGRSLIPPGGGQNPIEAGRLGCAVASGPYTGNFADAVQVLDDAGALARVTNAASIAAWVGAMLAAPEHRSKIGAQAAAAATRCAELPAQIAGDLLALMPARSD